MASWLHSTTLEYWASESPNTMTQLLAGRGETLAAVIQNPTMDPALNGQPRKYWKLNATSDGAELQTPAERTATDAAILSASRDFVADLIQTPERYERAFAEILLDEINGMSDTTNQIMDAINNASNLAGVKTAVGAIPALPTRTLAQLRTALRNKLG